MTNTDITAFLDLVPTARRERCIAALQVIETAQATGSILNVDFKDAKLTLDRSIEGAWNYGRGPALARLPENAWAPEFADLFQVEYDVSIHYVRDAIACSKKLAKTKVQHAWVESARAFVAAILPLALAMEQVKGTIVKGRRPPTPEVLAERAAAAAAKDSMPRATCGCCFHEQAVLANSKVHDHGYSLPHNWMKTSSCYGRHFRPLEVSDEGPRYMVDLAERSEKELVGHIATLKAATTLKVAAKHDYVHGHRVVTEWKDITTADAIFARVKSERISGTESDLKHCRRDLAEFRKVVAEWKPKEV